MNWCSLLTKEIIKSEFRELKIEMIHNWVSIIYVILSQPQNLALELGWLVLPYQTVTFWDLELVPWHDESLLGARWAGVELPSGYNPHVQAMRLTMVRSHNSGISMS